MHLGQIVGEAVIVIQQNYRPCSSCSSQTSSPCSFAAPFAALYLRAWKYKPACAAAKPVGNSLAVVLLDR